MKESSKYFLIFLCSFIVVVVIISTMLIVRNLIITESSKGAIENNINVSLLEKTSSLNPLIDINSSSSETTDEDKLCTYSYKGTYTHENNDFVFGKVNEFENTFEIVIKLFDDNSVVVTPKYSTMIYVGSYYGKYIIKDNILTINLSEYRGNEQEQTSLISEDIDINVSKTFTFNINEDNSLTANNAILNVPSGSVFAHNHNF